ncbi:MAG: DNA translocase FtsK 4TM domain-containing protein, partial [Planctomycetota bacterium]
MSRSDERKAALRFSLTAVGLLSCLFGWVCVLSFDVADPPASSVWPPNTSPANLCGTVGAWIAYHLFYYLGSGTYALLALLTLGIFAGSRGARPNDPWLRLVGVALVCTVVSAWSAILEPDTKEYLMTGAGGVLGTTTSNFLLAKLQNVGTHLVLTCALIVGLLLAADDLVMRLLRWLTWTGRRSVPVITRGGAVFASAGVSVASGVASLATRRGGNSAQPADTTSVEEDDEDAAIETEPDEQRASLALPPRQLTFDAEKDRHEEVPAEQPESPAAPKVKDLGRRPAAPKAPAPITPPFSDDENYELPPLELLEAPPPVNKEAVEILCREKAYILEQTLNEFRLEVRVVAIETGPVITVFELKLAPGIKVSQIASLTNDMARALKAPAVRVVAPLPGKNTIGIEVPNIDKEKVRLRNVIEDYGHRAAGYALPLYLGKDAAGQPLVSDLTRMPHLLIAGTTGSGKSVCIASIISSILMTRTPAEVQLILVDPKVVELAMYKDVPHLICPIVTEISKAEAILDWASTKMDERYALLAEAGVKDIRSYNRLGCDGLRERL